MVFVYPLCFLATLGSSIRPATASSGQPSGLRPSRPGPTPDSGSTMTQLSAAGDPQVAARGDEQGRWLVYLLIAITALGVVARLRAYVSNRALWIDEAMISLNIIDRSFFELLLTPLDYGQLAPAGFLVAVKAASSLLGDGERALRLVPLAAGLVALPLAFTVTRRIGGWRAAWFATAVIAVAPSAIYFSTEVKQYETDLLATLVALSLGLWAYRNELGARSVAGLAGLGALMVWLSHPVALVLGGVGLALLGQALTERRWRRALAVALVAGVWLANFVGGWIWGNQVANEMLVQREYFDGGFLPFPPLSLGELARWPELLLGLPAHVWHASVGPLVSVPMSMLLLGVWLIGLLALWRSDRWIFAMFTLPIGLALLASMLELYPLVKRLTVFLLPVLALPVALALDWICRWRGDLRVPGIGLALAVLILPSMYAALAVARPFPREELREVLGFVADRARPGDLVWVFTRAIPSFRYYARSVAPQTWGQLEVVEGEKYSPEGQLAEIRRVGGRQRVWCIFSHVENEERLLTFVLDDGGERLDSFLAAGASAYLYDLSDFTAAGT